MITYFTGSASGDRLLGLQWLAGMMIIVLIVCSAAAWREWKRDAAKRTRRRAWRLVDRLIEDMRYGTPDIHCYLARCRREERRAFEQIAIAAMRLGTAMDLLDTSRANSVIRQIQEIGGSER